MLAAVALFAVGGCGESRVLPARGARYAAASQAVMYAAYAWNAGDVISRRQAGKLWSFARTLHVKTFMLGFTDADIAKYSRAKGTARNVHFAGLNLDLEPNEVKGKSIKVVVMDLVRAMKHGDHAVMTPNRRSLRFSTSRALGTT